MIRSVFIVTTLFLFVFKLNAQKNESRTVGNPVPYALCSDMGVESGWNVWYGAPGSTNNTNSVVPTFSVSVSPPVNVPNYYEFMITSGNAVDPCTPGIAANSPAVPVVAPGFGAHSIQLGSTAGGNLTAEQLTFDFIPSISDTNFIYTNAVFIGDAGGNHALNEIPFASIVLLDSNGDTITCSYKKFSSPTATASPGYYSSGSSCNSTNTPVVLYKPWTSYGINLSAYVGQTIKVVITNADCTQGGHHAYSYWDFSCGSNFSMFCTGLPVTICAPVDTFSNATYQWYKNGNYLTNDTNSCIISNVQHQDTLLIYVTDLSGCNYYLQYIMQDTCLMGVENNHPIYFEPEIFPNPANTLINIDLSKFPDKYAEISLLNLLGETIQSSHAEKKEVYKLDISKLPEGIYFVKLSTLSGIATRKIIISK